MANCLHISRIILVSTIFLCLAYIHADHALRISKPSDNLWDELAEQGVNPHSNKSEYETQLCNTTATNINCYLPTCDDYDGQPDNCENETLIKNCFYTYSCEKCQPNNEAPKSCAPCDDFDGQKENCESEDLLTNCIYSCGKCQPNETAVICPTCDHWNKKEKECRAQPFCYWKCSEDKCVGNEGLQGAMKCNAHCVSFCDCQKDSACYHNSIANEYKQDFATQIIEYMSCKAVDEECEFKGWNGPFERKDCVRSRTGKNYYFLKGHLCSPPEIIDRGNCEIEKEIINGKFPALSEVETLVFSQIIEQGSYELMLQLDKLDFTNGSPQIYNFYINGLKFNMKFLKDQFAGQDTDITIVVYFVAEKRNYHPVFGFPHGTWTLDVKGSDFNWMLENLTVTTKHSKCDGANDLNTFTSFSLRKIKADECESYNGNACGCNAANSLCVYNETSGMCTELERWGYLPVCTRELHHNCVLEKSYDSVAFESGGLCRPPYYLDSIYCDVKEVMEAIILNGDGYPMWIRRYLRQGKVDFRSVTESFYNERNSDVPIKAVGPGDCATEFSTYVTNEESKSGCLHLNVSIPEDGTYELFIAGNNVFGIPHIFDVKLDGKMLIQGLDIWKLSRYHTCTALKIYKFFNVTQEATRLSFFDSQFETEIKEKKIKISFCNSECEKVKYKNFMVSAFAVFRYKTFTRKRVVS